MHHKVAHLFQDPVIAQPQARRLQPLAGGIRADVARTIGIPLPHRPTHLSGVAFHQSEFTDDRQGVALHLGQAQTKR